VEGLELRRQIFGGPEADDLHEPASAGIVSSMDGEVREYEVATGLDRLGLAHDGPGGRGAAEVAREPFLDLAVEATRLRGRKDGIARGERHRCRSPSKLAIRVQAKAVRPGEHGQ